MNTYFENLSTEEEIQARYKELVKEMHPDRGGTTEDFQELQREYEEALEEVRYRSPFLNEEYINLAKGIAGVFKAKKPTTYNKVAKVAAAAPIFLEMIGGNRTTKNISKFIEKLNL